MQIDNVLDLLITAGLENQYDSEAAAGILQKMEDPDWEELWRLAELHQIWGIAGAGLDRFQTAEIPEEIRERFRKAGENLAFQYYYMLSFTTYVAELLREEKIGCYVLKGIALNVLYPREEMRKLADADIYVPDPEDFRRAEEILKSRGFVYEEGFADFHSGYRKNMGGRLCLLELHRRPCGTMPDRQAEKTVREVYDTLPYTPDMCSVSGVMVPVLPASEYAFQILLHMMNHFIREGFGLRLLCDWSMFWKKRGSEVDEKIFLDYLRRTGLEGFAWTVTEICISHMGLERTDAVWTERISAGTYKESADMLYRDIISGGEFGKGEKSRMMIFRGSSPVLVSCVRAVHGAMRSRFPKAGRCPFAWPLLWGLTVLIFIRNNRRLDRGKTKEIIESAKNREKLLKQMKMFE